MKRLEEYLKENADKGIIDHSIRASVGAGGHMKFYVHPSGADGDTLDFAVEGNELRALQIKLPDGGYQIID